VALAGSPHETATEQIEARPTTHLAFQHLQAVDVSLDGARAPGHGGAGFDGFIVLIQSGSEASQGLQRTGGRTREPWIELRRLPLTDQRGTVLGQVDGLGDLG